MHIAKFVTYIFLAVLLAISFIMYANNKETLVTEYYLQLWTLFILLDIWYHGIDSKTDSTDDK